MKKRMLSLVLAASLCLIPSALAADADNFDSDAQIRYGNVYPSYTADGVLMYDGSDESLFEMQTVTPSSVSPRSEYYASFTLKPSNNTAYFGSGTKLKKGQTISFVGTWSPSYVNLRLDIYADTGSGRQLIQSRTFSSNQTFTTQAFYDGSYTYSVVSSSSETVRGSCTIDW